MDPNSTRPEAESHQRAPLAVQIPKQRSPMLGLCSPMTHRAPEELMEAYHYIEQNQGKGIRDLLIDAFNIWLQLDPVELSKIKYVVRMLHNASLLIDDIEDNSKMRRGVPVAHAIYGIPTTINCANYVYFLALEEVHNMGSPEAVKVFVDELLNLHRGQGWDILWRDSNIVPDEAQYRQMVIDKTGGLFRLATRLMQAFSDDKRDYSELVNGMGLYYQIRDDYINLQSAKYMENKAFCEDLSEGKFSFPIIHAILANKKDTRLLNILRRRTEDIETKKHAVEYMKSVGSFDYTVKTLKEIKIRVDQMLADFGGNAALTQIVQHLDDTML